ncbi:transposase [Streptomyces sp. TX20-6-3]|uniref:transposase n=1 Tax=Streptomyces sp. TX20-6-3 TaxID=3028705 RepID=UPI0029A6D0E3|nr:transposase [Streptomyces sp. TX20-6-3]MDX2565308.1 transposase [Streptomyces sp. TX20-6-3]
MYPQHARAAELAALYHQRWEIENTLDEIKTHQGDRRLVLRSQYPDGVEQEIYGFLLVHHALRDVMHQATHEAGFDPDRIPSTAS